MGMHLYELSNVVLRELETGIDEDTGEMSPELVHALAQYQDAGRAVAAYILNTEAEAEAVKAAVARMTARKRALESRASRLRDYLREQMAATGVTRIDADDKSFSVRFEAGRDVRVEIEPSATMTPEFILRTEVVPNKVALKAALMDGRPVPAGVSLVRSDRLTIK